MFNNFIIINNEKLYNSEKYPFLFINHNGTVIYNNKTQKLLDIYCHKNGYLQCTGGYWIHVIVAETFCVKNSSDKLEVNHCDGNKLNNNYKNLKWVTHSDNLKHAYKHKLHLPFWIGKHIPKDVCIQRAKKIMYKNNGASKARRIIFGDGTEFIMYTRQDLINELYHRNLPHSLSIVKLILNGYNWQRYNIIDIIYLGKSRDL